jgi:hypothetical protein
MLFGVKTGQGCRSTLENIARKMAVCEVFNSDAKTGHERGATGTNPNASRTICPCPDVYMPSEALPGDYRCGMTNC